MPSLSIAPKHHDNVQHLLAPIAKSDSTALLTFIIDKTHAYVIGGLLDALQYITLPIERDWKLKPGQWSLNASSFKEYWALQSPLRAQKQTITIQLNYDQYRTLPQIDTLTERKSRLYIQSIEALDAHLAFFERNQATFFKPIQESSGLREPTREMLNTLNIADTYRPFDAFELEKGKSSIRIERGGNIHPYLLPDEFVPNCNLLLNKESVDTLRHLCETTDSDEIQIYTDDECAIFSDGQRCFTSSLKSLREYQKKQEVAYHTEFRLVVDIHRFKEEIKSYRAIALVKQANEALLLVSRDRVMLAGLTLETGENAFLNVKDIKHKHDMVHRINLSELANVGITDITSAKQIKLALLKNASEGVYKLGFYNDVKGEHPYAYVDDVAPAPDKLSLVLDAKNKLEAKLEGKVEDETAQIDMVGYDDI
ncbi:hypothetical protein J4H58_07950 [Vibrio alginolyticus]|uniref:hypothetical protein n=1 Tax=Vibrio alginolyticus TaxID=663 RepID=UPI001BD49C68|nr:hypothetical protein [Vibrio alginolyticus]MBS9854698.1 hypothetical protein [Vibrio alginolyticus]